MRHRLGLATRTQISICKSPFPSADTAVSLTEVYVYNNYTVLILMLSKYKSKKFTINNRVAITYA